MLEARLTLQKNFADLFERLKERRGGGSRLTFSKEVGIGDGTLGRIKYGVGNPTLEVLERLGEFFAVEPWQLLAPDLGQDLLPRHRLDRTATVSELTAAMAQHLEDKPALRDLVTALVLRYESDPSEGDRIAEAIKTLVSR